MNLIDLFVSFELIFYHVIFLFNFDIK